MSKHFSIGIHDSVRDEDGGVFTMSFTGHEPYHLQKILESISDSSLSVEIFDAFLAEYVKTKDLDKARAFAFSEWDE